jgi:hypothetical protein
MFTNYPFRVHRNVKLPLLYMLHISLISLLPTNHLDLHRDRCLFCCTARLSSHSFNLRSHKSFPSSPPASMWAFSHFLAYFRRQSCLLALHPHPPQCGPSPTFWRTSVNRSIFWPYTPTHLNVGLLPLSGVLPLAVLSSGLSRHVIKFRRNMSSASSKSKC